MGAIGNGGNESGREALAVEVDLTEKGYWQERRETHVKERGGEMDK